MLNKKLFLLFFVALISNTFANDNKIADDKKYIVTYDTLLFCGINKMVGFLKGTSVTFNKSFDIVRRGTINDDTKLKSSYDSLFYLFKKGTHVLFDKKGFVVDGILIQNPMNNNNTNFIIDNNPQNRYLSEDKYLKCGINNDIEFLNGTFVIFHDNSDCVKRGVIKLNEQLLTVGNNRSIGYDKKSIIHFNKDGYIIKAY